MRQILEWLVLAGALGVYLVGSWVILCWVWERTVRRHFRLWFARKHGIPVPILVAWEEEWRRERGCSD